MGNKMRYANLSGIKPLKVRVFVNPNPISPPKFPN
jgi:hypothetical protein